MNNPKVLLAAPTSNYKDYIFLDWYIHALNLTYKNYDILICDNSTDEEYHKMLRNMGVDVIHISPRGKEVREYISESQNALRSHFLKGKYDFFFSLEVDVFPPSNIIEKLLISNKEVVSAPYFWKFGKDTKPLLSYFIKKDSGITTYEPSFLESLYFIDGEVKQVYENGLGCTLIDKRVLNKISFRWEVGNKAHSDTFFYIDLFRKGYRAFLDTSIICRHYNSDWNLNFDHMMAKDVKFLKT